MLTKLRLLKCYHAMSGQRCYKYGCGYVGEPVAE